MGTVDRTAPPIPLPFRECRIRASLLLKAAHGADSRKAAEAVIRFRALPPFSRFTPAELIAARDTFRLKHALAVIAQEQGYASWAELKAALEPEPARFEPESFFERQHSAFLNRWFARYEDARESLRTRGGFLFPFRNQFFVCDGPFLTERGVDIADPDWRKIGFDWARPADPEAQAQLGVKLSTLTQKPKPESEPSSKGGAR